MSQFKASTCLKPTDSTPFTTNDAARIQSFIGFTHLNSQTTPEKKIDKIFEEYFNGDSAQVLKLPHYEESNLDDLSLTPSRTTRHSQNLSKTPIWPKSHNVSCDTDLKSSM